MQIDWLDYQNYVVDAIVFLIDLNLCRSKSDNTKPVANIISYFVC